MIYAIGYLAPGKAGREWKSFASPLEALMFVQEKLAARCQVTVERDGQKIVMEELANAAQSA